MIFCVFSSIFSLQSEFAPKVIVLRDYLELVEAPQHRISRTQRPLAIEQVVRWPHITQYRFCSKECFFLHKCALSMDFLPTSRIPVSCQSTADTDRNH